MTRLDAVSSTQMFDHQFTSIDGFISEGVSEQRSEGIVPQNRDHQRRVLSLKGLGWPGGKFSEVEKKSHFDREGAAILLDLILKMLSCPRVVIFVAEQIVNARRQFEVPREFLREEGRVYEPISARVPAGERPGAARILDLQSREKFFIP